MSRPLDKCVSLGGWSSVIPDQTNDYRAGQPGVGLPQTAPDGPVDPATGKRAEVPWNMADELQALGVTYVKLWVNWKELAGRITEPRSPALPYALGRVPQTFEEQAQFMDESRGSSVNTPEPLIRYLDKTIKLANQRGLRVILTMYQAAPIWAQPPSPGTPPSRMANEQRFPAEMTADSPYGWFIRYLIARYTGHVTGGPGCGCLPARGNPEGARIDFIEPINEPNAVWWPQQEDGWGSYCEAAEAMTTCEWYARFYSQDYCPGFNPVDPTADWDRVLTVLGPATADRTNPVYHDNGTRLVLMGYEDFTEAVLQMLTEWSPVMRVGWAHHNYRDIETRTEWNSRALHAATLLSDWDFLKNATHLPMSWKRELWLTEGTYRIGREPGDSDVGEYKTLPEIDYSQPLAGQPRYEWQLVQSNAIRQNFEFMRENSSAVLWTQHTIHEHADNDEVYGLREKMRDGFDDHGNQHGVNGPGAKRVSWGTFQSLDPSP